MKTKRRALENAFWALILREGERRRHLVSELAREHFDKWVTQESVYKSLKLRV
jgi:hypothetical protein